MKPFLIGTLTIILGSVTQQIVNAETIPRLYGRSAGREYCRLRSIGVSHDQALDVAIGENLSPVSHETVVITGNGSEVTTGILDMVEYVARNCPGDEGTI